MKKSRLQEFTSSIFQQRSVQWFAALSSRLSLSFGYWFDASGNVGSGLIPSLNSLPQVF
jgi:hypothetical protein